MKKIDCIEKSMQLATRADFDGESSSMEMAKESEQQVRKKQRIKKAENTQVRIIHGRIYDPVNGKTCHWCRQKTLEDHVKCSLCTIHFCGGCLRNRHGEDIGIEMGQDNKWVCPKCRDGCGDGCMTNCCNCGPCRRDQGLLPTGTIVSTARQSGFSNVHDYLISLVTNESPEEIAKRKVGKSWCKTLPLHDPPRNLNLNKVRLSQFLKSQVTLEGYGVKNGDQKSKGVRGPERGGVKNEDQKSNGMRGLEGFGVNDGGNESQQFTRMRGSLSKEQLMKISGKTTLGRVSLGFSVSQNPCEGDGVKDEKLTPLGFNARGVSQNPNEGDDDTKDGIVTSLRGMPQNPCEGLEKMDIDKGFGDDNNKALGESKILEWPKIGSCLFKKSVKVEEESFDSDKDSSNANVCVQRQSTLKGCMKVTKLRREKPPLDECRLKVDNCPVLDKSSEVVMVCKGIKQEYGLEERQYELTESQLNLSNGDMRVEFLDTSSRTEDCPVLDNDNVSKNDVSCKEDGKQKQEDALNKSRSSTSSQDMPMELSDTEIAEAEHLSNKEIGISSSIESELLERSGISDTNRGVESFHGLLVPKKEVDCEMVNLKQESCNRTYEHQAETEKMEFEIELELALNKPFDSKEYEDLRKLVEQRLPKVRLRQLRQKDIHVKTKEEGFSYLDYYPDFSDRLSSASSLWEKISLLRGFFFWLKHLSWSGSFKPWSVVNSHEASDNGECDFVKTVVSKKKKFQKAAPKMESDSE